MAESNNDLAVIKVQGPKLAGGMSIWNDFKKQFELGKSIFIIDFSKTKWVHPLIFSQTIRTIERTLNETDGVLNLISTREKIKVGGTIIDFKKLPFKTYTNLDQIEQLIG
jgi:hypothetical protein